MKLHYKGKFDGNTDTLPSGELEKHPNAVKFKEIEEVNQLFLIMNIVSFVIGIIFFVIYFWRIGNIENISLIGVLLSCLTLFPHEFLHAICFKGDVEMYLASGAAFVCGTENMSKFRFIFMSMLPNIVFGFIPFIIFLIFPNLTVLGTLGAMAISMGAGDYYNVFNALTQMPHGARCFMEKQSSYWYMPEKVLKPFKIVENKSSL